MLLVLGGTVSVQRAQAAEVAVPKTALELATEIRAGRLSAEAVVQTLLSRIEQIDRSGPTLQSIITINPQALADARAIDAARASQPDQSRWLQGVPVLVKDNIETREMPTTAGSLALLANDTGRDAPIIARLRDAGAVVLGKTNMSEWANYRSQNGVAGWSGVGGLTRNPFDLSRSTCGSSSGSAAAVAAGLASAALGTETNGSIACPAAVMGLVGFKPTVGLLSRTHIVPLSPRQDGPGVITHTVEDAALLATVMAGTDPADTATVEADARREDYVTALEKGIQSMRIGVFRWAEGDSPAVSKAFNAALKELEAAGATLVEIQTFSPQPVLWQSGDAVLQAEFKAGLNAYLASAAPAVRSRSIAELIAFNKQHADRELALFDQDTLIAAQNAPSVESEAHRQIVAELVAGAREHGVDALLMEHDVRLLVMPSAKPAWPADLAQTSEPSGGLLGATWLPGMAGYPTLTVPMGDHLGLPLGIMFVGTAWDDAALLRAGAAYQRRAGHSYDPTFSTGDFERLKRASPLKPFRRSP
ncbi:MAG: amidase [Pseudomonadota bacterium]